MVLNDVPKESQADLTAAVQQQRQAQPESPKSDPPAELDFFETFGLPAALTGEEEAVVEGDEPMEPPIFENETVYKEALSAEN